MMLESWNRIFIILIFKKDNPKYLIDFRPISLCNITYKIIAKILAKRIQSLLSMLVFMKQGTFVQGRSITKNILLSQEVMYSLEHAAPIKGLVLFKVDMKKAYDRVRRPFLFTILDQFSFHHRFIS